MRDQSLIGQVVKVLLADGRADPVSLDPALRQAGPRRGSAPTRRSPFAFTVAFFARSKAAVFSFTIVAGEARKEQRGGGGGERSGRVRGRGD